MVSYEPLYRLIRERKIKMQDLSLKIGFQNKGSLATIASHHQHVSTEILSSLCRELECKPEDIIEFVNEKPEHHRVYVREDWQYSSKDYVIVDWDKVKADIKEKGYSMNRMSKEMGKEGCWIAMRMNRRYTKKTVIKQIADFLGKSLEEYL